MREKGSKGKDQGLASNLYQVGSPNL